MVVHRLFLCGRCRKQVLICSRCDRGNLYCSKECSSARRRESQREASRRYQNTPSGARNHAQRQKKYRASNKKVTHQGSAAKEKEAESSSVLELLLNGLKNLFELVKEAKREPEDVRVSNVCHFCGRVGSDHVRRGFMRSVKNIQ